MDASFFERILTAFKEYPGILALMCVIYWLFKSNQAKDSVIKDLIELSQGGTERTTRLATLIEMLVSRREKEVGQ